jgi:hypothetical protein
MYRYYNIYIKIKLSRKDCTSMNVFLYVMIVIRSGTKKLNPSYLLVKAIVIVNDKNYPLRIYI